MRGPVGYHWLPARYPAQRSMMCIQVSTQWGVCSRQNSIHHVTLEHCIVFQQQKIIINIAVGVFKQFQIYRAFPCVFAVEHVNWQTTSLYSRSHRVRSNKSSKSGCFHKKISYCFKLPSQNIASNLFIVFFFGWKSGCCLQHFNLCITGLVFLVFVRDLEVRVLESASLLKGAHNPYHVSLCVSRVTVRTSTWWQFFFAAICI